ncbi:hypothetical protein GQ44DRAFT_728912 [Phaeosphaeriaceae sp. PMI808]|nr:hypothetical protein GQ44DRAFT_728912 [Phaeosphaeriaceae sp. PMI808]
MPSTTTIYPTAPSTSTRTKHIISSTTLLTPKERIHQNATCTICLESLSDADPQDAAKLTRCGHLAHRGCLLQWTKEKSSCAYCRQEMFVVVAGAMEAKQTFMVPFASGGFEISERVWREWVGGCESAEERREVEGFRVVEGFDEEEEEEEEVAISARKVGFW